MSEATSISLSSDRKSVAIGAPFDDGNGTSAGHTQVFRWDGSSWAQLGSSIEGEAEGKESGSSISLSGAMEPRGNLCAKSTGNTHIFS